MSVILTRVEDGLTLQLDGYQEIRYNQRNVATDHPVELGGPITDHVQPEPLTFTITGALVTPAQTRRPNPAAVALALAFFETATGKLITVDTVKDGSFGNCVLTAWPHTQKAMMGRRFDLGFKQIRIATPVAVMIPPRLPSARAGSGMADKADAGVQAPAAATAGAEGSQEHASFLAAGYDVVSPAVKKLTTGLVPGVGF